MHPNHLSKLRLGRCTPGLVGKAFLDGRRRPLNPLCDTLCLKEEQRNVQCKNTHTQTSGINMNRRSLSSKLILILCVARQIILCYFSSWTLRDFINRLSKLVRISDLVGATNVLTGSAHTAQKSTPGLV